VLRQTAEITVPILGQTNLLPVDRAHGFVRRFVVTAAARHDGAPPGAAPDPADTGGVRADTARRSKASLALLDRRGPLAEFRPVMPRLRPMPAQIARGNASRGRGRSLLEQVVATEKRRTRLAARCMGLVRSTASITPAGPASTLRAPPETRAEWFPPREPGAEHVRPTPRAPAHRSRQHPVRAQRSPPQLWPRLMTGLFER
jgi:hypothetical protein